MKTNYKKNSSGYYRHRETYKGVKIDLKSKDNAVLATKVYERKKQIDDGNILNSENVKLKTWAETWLETYKKPSICAGNYNTYKTNIYNHILPFVGSMNIKDIKPFQLQSILNNKAGSSKSHIMHIRNAITGMFRDAQRNGMIKNNPAEDLTMPKSTEGTHRALTDDETKLLLEVCKKHHAGMFALMIYYCGLRPQEVTALLVSDIDLINNLVYVTKATEPHTRNNKEKTKTKSGIRNVPIPEELKILLIPYLKNKKPSDYYVTTVQGTTLTSNRWKEWFNSIKRDMDINNGAKLKNNQIIESTLADDLTCYCLRHTFCTDLQRAGVPLNIAKYLMGHKNIATTAKIYTHHTEDMTQAARESMNNFYSKTVTNVGSNAYNTCESV